MKNKTFVDNVFIITGAASGMGRELALQAAKKGAYVLATDWNGDGLQETALLGKEQGIMIHTDRLDVSDKQAITRFAETVTPTLGNRKLVLINNAGVGLRSGTFEQTDLDDFEWLVNINLWGAIRLTKAFYPYFMQRKEGHIVNTSSVFGFIGVAMNAPYCTSKFGLRGFTESLRMELRGSGVHVTSVHPGGIKTNIVRNALVKDSKIEAAIHKKSVDAFEKQALTTAEKAAKQILYAIEKKKSRLVIGMDGKAIDFISRLLPVAYTGILERQLKKAFGVS
jgi:butyryl-CoA dehydrogenase